jgi:hypothetical protein
MQRKGSLRKTVALGCGGLIVLLVVLAAGGYAFFRASSGKRVQSALERLKASGAPTTWEEVIPPPVPDEENAAVMYQEAFAALALPDPAQDAIVDYAFAPTREERQAHEEAAREALGHNAEALSYLRKAAARPKCRFDRDWGNPSAMLYPALSRMKQLSRLVCAQAMLQADDGDLPGALETWSLNLDFVNHLESDPMLLAHLTRVAIIAVADAALRPLLQQGRPRPEDCRRLADALAKVNLRAAFIKALEAERVWSLIMLDEAYRDPKAMAKQFGGTWLGYRMLRPTDEAALLRYWERVIALAGKPYREIVDEYDEVIDEVPERAVVAASYAPVYKRGRSAIEAGLAYAGLMRTGLGLAAYRARHGEYPGSLDRLRKALQWEVPEDPLSGRDFIYRREGVGYLLYSLGRDLDDDGGREFTKGRYDMDKGPDRDIVWRVER